METWRSDCIQNFGHRSFFFFLIEVSCGSRGRRVGHKWATELNTGLKHWVSCVQHCISTSATLGCALQNLCFHPLLHSGFAYPFHPFPPGSITSGNWYSGLCICMLVFVWSGLFILYFAFYIPYMIEVMEYSFFSIWLMVFPWWLSGKDSVYQWRRFRFDLWIWEDPLEKKMTIHSSNSCLENPMDRGD